MASPITVGTTATMAVPRRRNRANVRFQNVGATTLFFKREGNPTSSDFEFEIAPGTTAELNEAFVQTNSTHSFHVVSSASGGSLAIFETVYSSIY